MKNYIYAMLLAFTVFTVAPISTPQFAYAQEEVSSEAAPAEVDAEVVANSAAAEAEDMAGVEPPSGAEWAKLIESLGGLKGAGTLAIIAALVQLLMLMLRTKLGEMAGRWRLAAVSGLTLVAGVIGLKMQGMELMAALMHSSTLAMAQVFGFQLWKQFMVKKD